MPFFASGMLVLSVLAPCAAGAGVVDESRTSCRGYAPVRKSTFSNKMRLLYTVGLEHTGHHLWHEAIFPKVQLALSLIPTLTL